MKSSLKLAFLAFLLVVSFSHIHQGTLAVDAIRYARISWEVYQTGELSLFDHFSETPYVNKPPLLFWLTALGFKLFGFSSFVAKFPAVLFAVAGVIAIYAMGARRGVLVGVFGALLVVGSPNFTRNMLDLSFEGMVALGTALWLIGIVAWNEGRVTVSGLSLLFSIVLIAQSKPPYFGLLGLAAAPFIWQGFRRSWTPVVWVFFGVALGGGWYLLQGTEYLSGFADNQMGVTLTHRYPYFENLSRWIGSILQNFGLILVPGGYYLWRHRRNWGGLDLQARVLGMHALTIIPIVLFTAIRPRYAIVPMVALAPLAGVQLLEWCRWITERRLEIGLWVVSGVVLVAVWIGVQLHRAHEFVEYLRANPAAPDEIVFCQGGPDAEKAAGRARMVSLLLELEFGRRYRVESAYTIAGDVDLKVVPDRSCREVLEKRGLSVGRV